MDQPPSQVPDPTPHSSRGTDGVPETPAAPVQAREQVLFTIGDIGIAPHWVVTPNGTAPLAGTTWIVRDQTRTESKIANWALVTGIIVGVMTCGLGLLFLLIREKTTTGYVDVTVQGDKLFHVAQIPVSDEMYVAQVRQSVYQAQGLAAQLAQ